MATPAVIVVVSVALVVLLALALVIVALLRHVRALTGILRSLQEDMTPELESLAQATMVTQHELERVADRAIRLRDPDHPV